MSKAARLACGTALLLSVDAFSPTGGYGRPSLVTSATSEAAPCVCSGGSSSRFSPARCRACGRERMGGMRPARRRQQPTFRAFCKAYPHATGRQSRGGRAAGARQVCLRKKPNNPRPSYVGPGSTACCLFGARTHTRTHSDMCTCFVVCGHGMRECANRSWTGHSRFRYARLSRHAQGTPVLWETRAHRKRSIPATKTSTTSTTSTVIVCHSRVIVLSPATALPCASARTDMRLTVPSPACAARMSSSALRACRSLPRAGFDKEGHGGDGI